jgi:hypothetical protein
MDASLSEAGLGRARKAKLSLAEQLRDKPGITGIGIGLNHSKDGYAIHVLVRDEQRAMAVPSSQDGVDVYVDVIGGASAAETT